MPKDVAVISDLLEINNNLRAKLGIIDRTLPNTTQMKLNKDTAARSTESLRKTVKIQTPDPDQAIPMRRHQPNPFLTIDYQPTKSILKRTT